jgi:hypothetical protein
MKKQLLLAALAALSISASVQALITNREGGPTLGQRMGITSSNRERGSVWGAPREGDYEYEGTEERSTDDSGTTRSSKMRSSRNEPAYSERYSEEESD